jgi:methionyl-tRNA formyltransferase
LRVVFMGSPDFSVPTLRALAGRFSVVGVITQPDKPRGRGRKTLPTPVKKEAEKLGLPVIEPDKASSEDLASAIRSWNPEAIVVVAYGKLLPKTVLDIPVLGCVNLHASLLPMYRGPSPISSSIMNGDTVTGISTILMDAGMDTGDVLMMEEIPIFPTDTAGTLHDRMLEPGARLVIKTLTLLTEGKISPTPQNHALATYTRRLKKENGRIDWNLEAEYLSRLIRSLIPWPGAFFHLNHEAIRIMEAHHSDELFTPGRIGRLSQDGVFVGTGRGCLILTRVQAPGRKTLGGFEFAMGRRLRQGDLLD